jgi:hypothetical protein
MDSSFGRFLRWNFNNYIKSAELFVLNKIMKKLRLFIVAFGTGRAG